MPIYNPEQDDPWTSMDNTSGYFGGVTPVPTPVTPNYFDGVTNNTTNTPPTSSGTRWDLPSIYNTATDFLGMGNPSGTLAGYGDAMIAPALATAAKQYYDAGEYERLGERAASMANPFGDRSMYRARLDKMYTDPNYFMSDPSYQWRLNQGMGNVNRTLNAQGYQGSGKANIDLTNYAQNAASQEWAAEHKRLAELAGAQFDPANAAKYVMQGGELKLNSQNAALASLFFPALMKAGATTIDGQKLPTGSRDIDTILRIAASKGGDVSQLAPIIQAFKSGQISLDQVPEYWRSYVQASTSDAAFDAWATQQGIAESQVPIDSFGPIDNPTTSDTLPDYTNDMWPEVPSDIQDQYDWGWNTIGNDYLG